MISPSSDNQKLIKQTYNKYKGSARIQILFVNGKNVKYYHGEQYLCDIGVFDINIAVHGLFIVIEVRTNRAQK